MYEFINPTHFSIKRKLAANNTSNLHSRQISIFFLAGDLLKRWVCESYGRQKPSHQLPNYWPSIYRKNSMQAYFKWANTETVKVIVTYLIGKIVTWFLWACDELKYSQSAIIIAFAHVWENKWKCKQRIAHTL